MFQGVEKDLSFRSAVKCGTCDGSGSKSKSKPQTCKVSKTRREQENVFVERLLLFRRVAELDSKFLSKDFLLLRSLADRAEEKDLW